MSPETKADYESLLNFQLAELLDQQLKLKDQTITVLPEHSQEGSSKRIDVLISYNKFQVALEAEIDNPQGAFKDARARLVQNQSYQVNVDAVIGVNYPQRLQTKNFNDQTRLGYFTVETKDQQFDPGRIEKGNVKSLARFINNYSLSQAHLAPKRIKSQIELLAPLLDDVTTETICQIMGGQQFTQIKNQQVDNTTYVSQQGLLIILAAGMFQAHLDHFTPPPPP